MIALSLAVAVGVEEPAFVFSGFLVVDRLFSRLHFAVPVEIEVGGFSFADEDLLSSGLHLAQMVKGILLSVDGEKLISLFSGKIRLSGFEIEGIKLICIVESVDSLDGAEAVGALSVIGLPVILVVCDTGRGASCVLFRRGASPVLLRRGGRILGGRGFRLGSRRFLLRHRNPSSLHYAVDKGIVGSVDLFIVLCRYHFSVGIKVVPVFRSAGGVRIGLQADPAGPHGTVASKIVGGTVDLGFSGLHVAVVIEIVPFGIQLDPAGYGGFSVLPEIVPEGSGHIGGIQILLIAQLDPGIFHHFSICAHIVIIDLSAYGNLSVLVQIEPVFSILSPGIRNQIPVLVVIDLGIALHCPAGFRGVGGKDSRSVSVGGEQSHARGGSHNCKNLCGFFHNCFLSFFSNQGVFVSLRADYNNSRTGKSSAGYWQRCQPVTAAGDPWKNVIPAAELRICWTESQEHGTLWVYVKGKRPERKRKSRRFCQTGAEAADGKQKKERKYGL